MLITDFLPLDFPRRNLIVKGFERYSVEEFLSHFESITENGGRINTAYQNAIDYIKKRISTETSSENVDSNEHLSEIEMKLNKIPIKELKLYYRKKSLDGIIPKLSSIGIKTLADLYRKPVSLSRKNDIELGRTLKEFVSENYNILINDWEESSQIIELPTHPSDNLINDALSEMTRRTLDRQNQLRQWKGIDDRRNILMQLAFIEGLSIRGIANELQFSSFERPRQILMDDILKPFLAGNILFENLKLRNDIVERLSLIKSQYLFKEESHAIDFLGGIISEEVAKVIGIDFVNITDNVRFIIPIDTKRIYNDVVKVVFSELRNAIEFKSPDKLAKRILSSKNLPKKDFESQFVYNLLSCKAIVNINEDGVQIHEALLGSNEQRLSRIIYEINTPITREKVLEIYKTKYGTEISTGFNVLEKYGIKNTKSNLWEYLGDSINEISKLAPIEEKVAEYASTHKCFLFNDLISWLYNQGYIISTKASIRTYVTNVCTPSNHDKDLFCHKDFTDEFPQHSWRETHRDGMSNWILNELNNIFNETNAESLNMAETINIIEKASINTEYNYRIRQRAKAVITTYSGENNPFIIDNDYIYKNSIVYPTTNFEIIGLKGKNMPYFSQIRALASNALKHTNEGKLPLVDFIKMVNESGFDKKLTRRTIISAIETTRLPKCNITLKSHNNIIYLEYIQPPTPQNISYSKPINWEQLSQALKVALNSYDNMLKEECGRNISYGVDLFISHLKQSTNSILNDRLPRIISEYWDCHVDEYDKLTCLSKIAIIYQTLLVDILNSKGYNMAQNSFDGITQFFAFFNDAAAVINIHKTNGFARIFKNISFLRHSYTHGQALNITSSEISQYITDSLALYVFTITKHA